MPPGHRCSRTLWTWSGAGWLSEKEIYGAPPEQATDQHLELLRQIASIFEQDDVRERLRHAPNSIALYQAVLDAQL